LNDAVFTRRWQPSESYSGASRPCGVYLLHGTGEHCGRYEELASHLTNAGWAVAAHDQPGHGRSAGQRGSVLPQGVIQAQAAIQILQFANETGASPVVLGHSLGGVLAAELVLTHHLPVSGLILSAPAFRPWITSRQRLKLSLLYKFFPDKVLELPGFHENLTHDAEKLEAVAKDEWVHGFKSARLVRWLFDSGTRSIELAPNLPVPALALIAGSDPVIDPNSMREWVQRAPKEMVNSHEYEGAFHELFNEIPSIREKVTNDTLAWLEGIQGLP